MRAARAAASPKAETTRSMPARSSTSGNGPSSVNGNAEGATVRQPRTSSGAMTPSSRVTPEEAFRPACDNWMPIGMLECARTERMTFASAVSVR